MTCKHEWNNEFSLWDILEIEYTHVLIKIKCSKYGMKGLLDCGEKFDLELLH